jgi:uncharacterized protein YegP (UPF0339 family)
MATATKQSRTAKQLAGRALDARVPASMEFLIFEDNGGSYYWTIVAGDGATLARSGNFGSYDDAEQAAQDVPHGAAAALFEHRGDGARPVDPIARRKATTDGSDAERWLDEGGSFSSEAVAKWRAQR